MHTGKGQVFELLLKDGLRHARLICPETLIPSPGQYLLGSDLADALLPIPVFFSDPAPDGFITAAPVPDSWTPGLELHLRGPLGRGFLLPALARNVGLLALEGSPARLNGLIQPALQQDASVVLVTDIQTDSLPDEVEVQPLAAFSEILQWADYLAIDVAREALPELRAKVGNGRPSKLALEAQVLVRTPLPCGGLADCGACAVTVGSGWKMACQEGPVFDWREVA